VRAIYLHARKALQEVGQWIDLDDHQRFNAKLNQAIQRIEELFDPGSLQPPTWLADFTRELPPPDTAVLQEPDADSPFTEFIEQLFEDDDKNTSSI
jgi:hypothetical protein